MKKNGYTSLKFEKTLHNSNRDWQFEFPEWDMKKCNHCGICYLACPDSAISQNNDGFFKANEALCKGCGMCAEHCNTNSISLNPVAIRPPWLTKIE